MTCPDCEYNKARAANWRAEAYKLIGHDYIPRLWVGLTDEEIEHIEETTTCYGEESWLRNLTRNIEAKLKEKNT